MKLNNRARTIQQNKEYDCIINTIVNIHIYLICYYFTYSVFKTYIISGCCGMREVKNVLTTVHNVVIKRSFCLTAVSSVFPFCSCDKFLLSSTC